MKFTTATASALFLASLATAGVIPDENNEVYKRQPWYSRIEDDAVESKVEKRQPWYSRIEDDAVESKVEKRQPWYSRIEDDAVESKVEKRQPWYSRIEDDAVESKVEKRQPWYSRVENDAVESKVEKRQPWYSRIEDDAVEEEKRSLYNNYPFSAIASSDLASHAAASNESLSKRVVSLEEHDAKEQKTKDWVYGRVRDDPLRISSDRGVKMLSYEIKPATDRVDRDHVPAHLEQMIAAARTDQERVSLLNFYLQVTGRDPRPASELGYDRTRDEPTLVDTDEVGFGYATGQQHQIHCANMIADAVDLGKDNINDFWMIHIVHCVAMIKVFAGALENYRDPVQPLNALARARLDKNYEMADWEDENGNVISMLHRNPKVSSLLQSLDCQQHGATTQETQMTGWVIFLIVEAVLATVGLTIMVGWRYVRDPIVAIPAYLKMDAARFSIPAYFKIGTASFSDEDEKPFMPTSDR
ncbi:hypothetical protein PG984_015269 [Apiospora sp. TS-2023a]